MQWQTPGRNPFDAKLLASLGWGGYLLLVLWLKLPRARDRCEDEMHVSGDECSAIANGSISAFIRPKMDRLS